MFFSVVNSRDVTSIAESVITIARKGRIEGAVHVASGLPTDSPSDIANRRMK